MRCVVTGSAGFLGSHLCEELLRRGHTVVGIDAFVSFAPAAVKARNQSVLLAHPHYRFLAIDLRKDDLADALTDADLVFHLAAVPGIPRSSHEFDESWSCNVQATQRLLDAVRDSSPLKRFIYASTCSVYGRHAIGPETMPTQPLTPYGIAKLAAENLCRSHADAHRLPLVILRYFNLYGPRQRPDMAYHRFIAAIQNDQPIELHGDGRQERGSLYVTDAVAAALAAVEAPIGEIYNVGGPDAVAMIDAVRQIEALAGRTAVVSHSSERLGDQRHAVADVSKIRNHLGWEPHIRFEEGILRQWQWQTAAPADAIEPKSAIVSRSATLRSKTTVSAGPRA